MTVEPAFNPDELRPLLASLTRLQRLTFGIACSERLYPNYLVFAGEQGWGEPEPLREALDLAWNVVLGRPSSSETIRRLVKRVEAAEPEPGDFETVLASSALDAAMAAGLVLKLLEADAPEVVIEIASLCRDTVDMYIQDREALDLNDAALEEKILLHRLMQAELQRQREDLRILAGTPWSSAEASLRKEAWRAPKVGNLGLVRSL